MNYLLIIMWIFSMGPLLLFPYSIAAFYQRSFGRKTYPYLFFLAFIMLIAPSFGYIYPYFSYGWLFFAMGGILLGLTSLRLDHVMTRRNK